ncbi:tyrosine-protein kinase domain-containing protein [Yinghuangia seranimata]|uniref:tyrosine-protein kinase domain-containing protein n=1 Tax=Yinghuangia seranimata TaxID=408067 RepID=UPI00248C543D|nr:tyrosine-protein kinase domain-containing protein [Yinghuangia seranimata]MDI2130186.1 AAA family ATPase [Yinghuangia seranimata]
METSSYFSVLQRRWKLVLACLAVGLIAGFMLTPKNPKAVGNQWSSTIDLVKAPESMDNEQFSLMQVKLVSESGDVAKDVGTKTHQDPALIGARVNIGVDTQAGTLSVTAKGASKNDAELLARTWAESLRDAFAAKTRANFQQSADGVKPEMQKAEADIAALQKQVDQLPEAKRATSTQLANLNAKLDSYNKLVKNYEKWSSSVNDPKVLVQDNMRSTPQAATSILAPTSRPLRLALAAALGLALGLVAALMVDRMDMRLRSRMQVEDAFGMPVIAEVPVASRRMRAGHAVLVAARPDSPVAEAYRALRSALLLSGPPGLAFRLGEAPRTGRTSSLPARQFTDPAPVILVVSPKPGDGRTSTVANLAAALAEAGRSVLVLDCDFRNPETHLYLGAKPGTGLSELLLSERETDLVHVIRSTEIPHVKVITGGAPTSYPAALLLRVGDVIARARHHADVVLLDSAPLLFANDTNDLIQHSDAMLVVTRSGNLTPDQASRVSELLTRTGVPVAGIALIGTDPSTVGVRGRGLGGLAVPGSGLILRGRGGAAALEAADDGQRSAPSWARREIGDGSAPPAVVRPGGGEDDDLPRGSQPADPDSFMHTAELRTISVRPGEPRGGFPSPASDDDSRFERPQNSYGGGFLDDDPADHGHFGRPGGRQGGGRSDSEGRP